MTDKTTYPLTPEARALLERLIVERDAAVSRLDVALLSMKAALGVPVDWTIRNVAEGFVEGDSSGEHTRISGDN